MVSEKTVKPSIEEHMLRLSRRVEGLRGDLASYQTKLTKAQLDLPGGVLEGLRQISGTLQLLKETVEENEVDRRNLHALAEIGQVVNSSLDLEMVLNEVMDTIIKLTGAERAFLMLRDALAVKDFEDVSVKDIAQYVAERLE